MTELYITDSRDLYKKTRAILGERCGGTDVQIDFTRQKPELAGTYGGIKHFNISHSGDVGVIALSNLPVGVDVEIPREKEHRAILSRFSPRERGEIKNERDFLMHWTAREAFVKYHGAKLAEYFRRLEFYRGQTYLDGDKQNVKISFVFHDGCIVAVCATDRETKIYYI